MKKRRLTAIVFGIMAVAWAGLLFFFSGQTGVDSGELSSMVTEVLFGWLIDRGADFQTLHVLTRKLAHFGIFAVEGWLLGSALLRAMKSRLRASWATVLVCAAIAAFNELHQIASEGRSCSVLDMLIDTCGAAAGLALAVVIWHAFSAFKRRKSPKYITLQ